jgi:hypothetical protein
MQNQAGYHRQAFLDVRSTFFPIGCNPLYTLFGKNINCMGDDPACKFQMGI